MGEKKNHRRTYMILGLVIVVAVTLALIVVGFTSRQSDDESRATPEPTAPPSPALEEPHGETGEWHTPTSDVHGRGVRVPANGVGNPLTESVDTGNSTRCDASSSDVTLQLSHNMETMWSPDHGPSSLAEETVPVGYARTAEAAMMAGWNTTALMYAGGPASAAAVRHGAVGDNAERLEKAFEETTPAQASLAEYNTAPTAFKVTSCSDEQVIGDVALPDLSDSQGNTETPTWTVLRMSMVWADGDWKLQFGEVMQPAASEITDLSGWTEWDY